MVYSSYGVMSTDSGSVQADYVSYTGREAERDLNIYYYRARYYDPLTGRFMVKDPLGLAAGDVNHYRYVRNLPASFVDPYGMAYVYVRNLDYGWVDWIYNNFHYVGPLVHKGFYYGPGDNSSYVGESIVTDEYLSIWFEDFHLIGPYLDDCILRQAERQVASEWDKTLNPDIGFFELYDLYFRNCKDYVEEVLKVYYQLKFGNN